MRNACAPRESSQIYLISFDILKRRQERLRVKQGIALDHPFFLQDAARSQDDHRRHHGHAILGSRLRIVLVDQVGKFVSELTEEEADIEQELKKVLSLPKLKFNVTCVQAPVFAGISIAACLQTQKKAEVSEIRTILGSQAGILVMDNPGQEEYPDVLSCLEQDQVLVGRIRKEPSAESGFQLWINSDNLRKGSSLNMVQTAQLILEQGLI